MNTLQIIRKQPRLLSRFLLLVAVFIAVFVMAVPTFAQTAVPIAIDIPTDTIFAEVNNWIGTFAPIAAIGIGIAIALAILAYIAKAIIAGFKN